MSVASCMSARNRINSIVDHNSFVELGGMILGKYMNSSINDTDVLGDGVITGYGLIQSNPVYIYCQDSSILNGTIGESHAKKIAHIYDLALKVGAPVIGIIDSAGLRLQEATDVMQGLGEIYQKKVLASGVIPQISIVLGNCGGGLAVLTSLSDFTFMEKNSGNLFLNPPNVYTYDENDKINRTSPTYNASVGKVDFLLENEEEIFQQVRELISLIPASNDDKSILEETTDNLNRKLTELQEIGIRDFIREIADYSNYFDIRKHYAKDMVTGFIKLNGLTIGLIANNKESTDSLDGDKSDKEKEKNYLSADGCVKASEFIRFCNAFHIPILTLSNTYGLSKVKEDEVRLSIELAKLVYEYGNASVPKVTLILGDSYGTAYIAMNSKHIGADLVYALSDISIGTMEAEIAAKILISECEKKDEKLRLLKEENTVLSAAKKGYVDVIISREAARKHLIYAFDMLYTKRVNRPRKKHGTV